jgi:hypothetical protein
MDSPKRIVTSKNLLQNLKHTRLGVENTALIEWTLLKLMSAFDELSLDLQQRN